MICVARKMVVPSFTAVLQIGNVANPMVETRLQYIWDQRME